MTFSINKSDWTKTKFGEVVMNTNETVKDPLQSGIQRFIGLDHMDSEQIRLSRFGNTSDGVTFTKRVKPGQTLFGKRRSYQRKVVFAEFEAVCSGDILAFSAKPELLDHLYLPFLVMSEGFFARALATSAGSLSPRTRWSDLAKFEFLLPSLVEQREIANLFWALEGQIASIENLAHCFEQTRASYLQHMLNPLEIDAEWRALQLDEVCTVVSGGTPSTLVKEYWDGDIPWVTPTDMTNTAEEFIDSSQRKISQKGLESSGAKMIPANSLLITSRASIGVAKINKIPISTNQGLQSLVPNELTSVKFLKYWIEANQHALIRNSSGTTFPEISNGKMKRLRINLPPIEVQDSITERMDQIIDAIDDKKSELKKLIFLRNNLSQFFFEGTN